MVHYSTKSALLLAGNQEMSSCKLWLRVTSHWRKLCLSNDIYTNRLKSNLV